MTDVVEAAAGTVSRDFSVQYQKVYLDVDFRRRAVSGRTELQILPDWKDLKTIRLNCRQTKIKSVSVEGRAVDLKDIKYTDPYECAKPYRSFTVHQHHQLRNRIKAYLDNPPKEELEIPIPRGVRITDSSAPPLTLKLFRTEAETPQPQENAASADSDQTAAFTPLKIEIEFETANVRDGLVFVGFQDGDMRYPHVYTNNSPHAGTACSLFPCVDDPRSRHLWDISIRCPRTLGDAFARSKAAKDNAQVKEIAGDARATSQGTTDDTGLTERDNALDLSVICSGNLTDEIVDPYDAACKTVSFSTASVTSANQIGFAIGPFEDVDLSDFRELDDDEKLGTQAVRIHGYCLPGRAMELRNTCMPIAKAIDYFTTTFTTYAGDSYKVCFVDDLPSDYSSTANLSICSTRLLFAEDVLELLSTVPRIMIDALAAQYAGIALVAADPDDAWLIAGMRTFMTDSFMKQLSGNNEYRYRQKRNADRVHELDVNRPSLKGFGSILHLDPSETEFMTLKAGVVLFILDRRLTKSSGSAGIVRVISRFLTTSKGGDADATFITTNSFQTRCQKMGHLPLDSFFEQWVINAGCPTFQVTQRFNKKRMVVEMLIRQIQPDPLQQLAQDLDPNMFLRDLKEDEAEVWAGTVPAVFVGPMTIRVHEADGTPYEHIVDIKEVNTRFEIPYNTKYKRLGRNRRQRERLAAASGPGTGEGQDDVLLYCLGDVLQSQDEVADWRLTDWSKEDEDRMNQESYEWIRMDADFEWICKLNINMPAYMFVSQLQQDRDVVAQMETLQYIAAQRGVPLISTILTRTAMDRRYFYGVRLMAIEGLVKCATEDCDWIGMIHLQKIFHELFCVPNSVMMRPNDFSDRTLYFLQCTIPRSLGRVKDSTGETPAQVKRFFLEKLKFNDNSENEFSDNHYMATLLCGLAEALSDGKGIDSYDDDIERDKFRKDAVNEIERYRRIDEWISSFQNIYSITALDCLLKLGQGKVMQPVLQEFLQYTRVGNGDNLRLKAFECLVELGMLRNNFVFKYLVFSLAVDQSAYFRSKAYHILGRGLARIAMGEKKPDPNIQSMDGLVIEQEGSTDARQTELARRQTVQGAIDGLKEDLGKISPLKDVIWTAVSSPTLNLAEINNFLELCSYLYEEEDKLEISLKYPRYWQAKHVGKAVVAFSRTNKVRTKKARSWVPHKELPAAAAPAPPPPVTKIKLGIPQIKAETSQPPTPTISLKPTKAPKAVPPAPPAPVPPKIKIEPTPAKVVPPAPKAIAAVPAQPIVPTTPAPLPAPAARAPSTIPATPVVTRPSRLVVLKIRRDRLGRWPTGARGPKPTALQQGNGNSVHLNGHGAHSRPTTPAISLKSDKAMSPPPRPVSSGAPPAKKQKTSQPAPAKARTTTSASPAPTVPKKRKNSNASVAAASAEPPAKRPVLKLKLKSSSMAKFPAGSGSSGQ